MLVNILETSCQQKCRQTKPWCSQPYKVLHADNSLFW